jgi:hypothetical protein
LHNGERENWTTSEFTTRYNTSAVCM